MIHTHRSKFLRHARYVTDLDKYDEIFFFTELYLTRWAKNSHNNLLNSFKILDILKTPYECQKQQHSEQNETNYQVHHHIGFPHPEAFPNPIRKSKNLTYGTPDRIF